MRQLRQKDFEPQPTEPTIRVSDLVDPTTGRPYYLMPAPPPPFFWVTLADAREDGSGPHLRAIEEKIQRDVALGNDDFQDYHRFRGREDLWFFARYCMGFTWLSWGLHAPIAWAWQAPNGWRQPTGQKLGRFRWATIPRGHLKTTLLTQAYAAWRVVRSQEERILLYTMGDEFASMVLSPLKMLFEGGGTHGELFTALYGEIVPPEPERGKKYDWNQHALTMVRKGNFTDPTIRAKGVGSRVTGGHYTVQLIDDLVGEELNRTQMDKVIRSFDNLTPLYHSIGLGERRMVGTPWAFFDPLAYAGRHWKDSMVARLSWQDAEGAMIFDKCDAPEALNLKRRNSWFFSCNIGAAPILMADWSFKRLEDVQIGDMVMGWASAESGRQRLIPSKVLEKASKLAPTQNMYLASGNVATCTPDHKWWTGKKDVYKPAKLNSELVRVVNVPVPLPMHLTRTAAWLGGVFDGEGSVHPGGPISISQSKKANPQVCKAIEAALNELGFKWVYRETNNGCGDYRIQGGRSEALRFIDWCRPVRGYKVTDSITRQDIAREKDAVNEIEDAGEQVVYRMQTETGNYVAWGLASKNCQYECWPKDEEKIGFRREWFRYFTQVGDQFVLLDADGKHVKKIAMASCNFFLFIDPNTGRAPGDKASIRDNAPSNTKHDYMGWIVLAVTPDNEWLVPRAIRWRCNPHEAIDKTYELIDVWKPQIVAIEQIASQYLWRYLFLNEWRRGRTPFNLVDWESGGAAKIEERIKGLIPFYSQGRVYHRDAEQPEVAAGIAALEGELLDHPRPEYDDLSDALSAGIALAYAPGQQNQAALRRMRQDAAFEERVRQLDPGSRLEAIWLRRRANPTVGMEALFEGEM